MPSSPKMTSPNNEKQRLNFILAKHFIKLCLHFMLGMRRTTTLFSFRNLSTLLVCFLFPSLLSLLSFFLSPFLVVTCVVYPFYIRTSISYRFWWTCEYAKRIHLVVAVVDVVCEGAVVAQHQPSPHAILNKIYRVSHAWLCMVFSG